MMRYGVEYHVGNKSGIYMSDDKEACIRYCEKKAKTMGKGESYVLFRSQVGDDGRFAGGPQQILQIWSHHDD